MVEMVVGTAVGFSAVLAISVVITVGFGKEVTILVPGNGAAVVRYSLRSEVPILIFKYGRLM